MLCGAYTEMTVQSCRSCDICCSITSAVRPLFIINNFINNSGLNLTVLSTVIIKNIIIKIERSQNCLYK